MSILTSFRLLSNLAEHLQHLWRTAVLISTSYAVQRMVETMSMCGPRRNVMPLRSKLQLQERLLDPSTVGKFYLSS